MGIFFNRRGNHCNQQQQDCMPCHEQTQQPQQGYYNQVQQQAWGERSGCSTGTCNRQGAGVTHLDMGTNRQDLYGSRAGGNCRDGSCPGPLDSNNFRPIQRDQTQGRVLSGSPCPTSACSEDNFSKAANDAAARGVPLVLVVGDPAQNRDAKEHLSKAWSMQNGYYEEQGRSNTRRHYKDEAVFVNVDPSKVKEGTMLDKLLKEQQLTGKDAATLMCSTSANSDGASLSVKQRFDTPTDPFKLISAHDALKTQVRPTKTAYTDAAELVQKQEQKQEQTQPETGKEQEQKLDVLPKISDLINPAMKQAAEGAAQNLYEDARNGGDTLDVKPESKQEAKPEVQPEVKPEVQPEVSPEAKPEAKQETKPEVSPEVVDFGNPPGPSENTGNGTDSANQQGAGTTSDYFPKTTEALKEIEQREAAETQNKTREEALLKMVAGTADRMRIERIESFDRFYTDEIKRTERAGQTFGEIGSNAAEAKKLLKYDDMNLIAYGDYKREVAAQYGVFSYRDTIIKNEDAVQEKRNQQWEGLKRGAADPSDPNHLHKQYLLYEIAKGTHLPKTHVEQVSSYHDYRKTAGNQITAQRGLWQAEAAETLANIAANPKLNHDMVARLLPTLVNNQALPELTRVKAMTGIANLANDTTSSYMDVRTTGERENADPLAVNGSPRDVAIASILNAMHKDNSNPQYKPSVHVQKEGMRALTQLKAVEAMRQVRSLGKQSMLPELRQMTEDYNKGIIKETQSDYDKMAREMIEASTLGK